MIAGFNAAPLLRYNVAREEQGMPDDEPKSAWEITMEKLKARGDSDIPSLTEEQKTEIAEIRTRFRAKLAELEIRHHDVLKKAAAQGASDASDKLRAEFTRDKERLREDEETLLKRVRDKKA